MSYCLECGTKAQRKIPKGDTRERIVCDSCGYIHYQNPNVVCGALVVHKGKILMCRRAIEPRHGFWTLPAGFLEIGETMMEGAKRETAEEALAIAIDMKLYCLFDIPALGQIHVMYLANLDTDKKYESTSYESTSYESTSYESTSYESTSYEDIDPENMSDECLSKQAYGVGEESLETTLVAIDDIDWDNVAFESIRRTLKYYIEDSKLLRSQQLLNDVNISFDNFPLYEETIDKNPDWNIQ